MLFRSYLDLSTKTMTQYFFNYIDSFGGMSWLNDGKPVLSKSFSPTQHFGSEITAGDMLARALHEKIDDLGKYPDSKVNYISNNRLAYDDGSNYHSSTEYARINRAQSHVENFDNMVHDLTLAGDFNLKSGQMIEISIPPAIDPGADIKNSQAVHDIKKDSYFSGKYIVTGAVHKFAETYTVNLKVKRDSLVFELH